MNFLHYYHPQSILFQLGPITIHWYGLIVAAAILLAISVSIKLAKEKKIFTDDYYDLAFWLVLSGLIGARLYDVLLIDWQYYCRQPAAIVKIWQGGLAIHGAIIGGVVALLVWIKIKKIKFWELSDLIVPGLALAQAVGRWGNYFNQELFGRPTSLPWGIPIAAANRPPLYGGDQYFQPAFLYESLLDFLLFITLFILYRKNKLSAGTITALYFVGYGVIRFAMEFIRIDETPVFGLLRLPQWASLGLILLGIFLFIYQRQSSPKKK